MPIPNAIVATAIEISPLTHFYCTSLRGSEERSRNTTDDQGDGLEESRIKFREDTEIIGESKTEKLDKNDARNGENRRDSHSAAYEKIKNSRRIRRHPTGYHSRGDYCIRTNDGEINCEDEDEDDECLTSPSHKSTEGVVDLRTHKAIAPSLNEKLKNLASKLQRDRQEFSRSTVTRGNNRSNIEDSVIERRQTTD
ncbi:hypothetical protein WR25_12002 [Diploscapter pachys]|uniref:Uncharacterized protein n=1 Tax=Diploscapter pachys TaxID=2018661 RepID=A0A2A2K6K0_9BILA|nr:hypothetical protein WR25_12002 [Diploscapter pachys]